MIDNYSKIKDLLIRDYESGDTFYDLQIIQRRKDNPHLAKTKVIKSYWRL